ncbi:unnamed protein product [Ilex paraguariensis]|uniref:Pentatricopeptide repeat-containing protein n=1 Tax=Ilex paraguariensis TaxID=185542 RepID=A0ABC8UDR2_9AQUA
MNNLNLPISKDIYISLIKECIATGDLNRAMELDSHLNQSGIRHHLPLLNHLLIMYLSCGFIENAHQLFDRMPIKDLNSWAAMIFAYVDEEKFEETICLFIKMQHKYQYHCNEEILKFLVSWMVCGLVDMYGKFGLVRDARRMFEMNGVKKNAACWNAMLNTYIQHGCCIEAVKVLYEMKGGGLEPRESLVNEV